MMTSTAPSIRWGSILVASVSIWVASFVLIGAIILAYGFSLGFAARGAPDQAAIQEFANAVGPTWGPRLSILLTALAAFWIGRRVTASPVLHGAVIGLVVGGVPLAMRRPSAIEPILMLSVMLLAGVLGGWLGGQMKASTDPGSRHAR